MAPKFQVASGLRFEIFYALQQVAANETRTHAEWHASARHALGGEFLGMIEEVAPHPLFWPLLAEVPLIDRPDSGFDEVVAAFAATEPRVLVRRLLTALFKDEDVASRLASGSTSLNIAVAESSPAAMGLLKHLGLSPFQQDSGITRTLQFLIDSPVSYRGIAVDVLRTFWKRVFRHEWITLSVRLNREAARLRRKTVNIAPEAVASRLALPIQIDDSGGVLAKRGSFRASERELGECWIMPSAFNVARLWTTQRRNEVVDVYMPLFVDGIELFPDDTGHSEADVAVEQPADTMDAALILKALGDSTRYTIASVIAKSATTSVALAAMLEVSKPTVSHHIRILREAGLVDETPAPGGVFLTLRRGAIAGLSAAALEDLFSDRDPVMSRSRRQ